MTSIMLQPQALQAVMDYAAQMVASGYLPKAIDTPQKAVAIITLGYELGLTPWAAINGVNVIAGKPTISPALMLGLINRSGFLENMTIEADDTRAIVTMKRFGRAAHTETFTIEDAARMKTTEWVNNAKRTIPLSEKDNWKQQPRVMLKWRAVSACARVVFPDVLAGLYTTEEISPDNTTVSEDGEITYEPPPMLEAGEPPKQVIPATNGNGKASTPPPATDPPFIEHGTTEETFVVRSMETVKHGNGKRLKFKTESGRIALAFSRELFKDRGWIEDEGWIEIGNHPLPNAIPVTITYWHHTSDTGEITGGYWEVTAVGEVVF